MIDLNEEVVLKLSSWIDGNDGFFHSLVSFLSH